MRDVRACLGQPATAFGSATLTRDLEKGAGVLEHWHPGVLYEERKALVTEPITLPQ